MSDFDALHPLDPHLRAVNDTMLDGLGQLADYFGYNRVLGKMYGALLLSPSPMNLDDLLTHLDISKASVSMNMRMLENLGLVREVWVRGDRRKYYEAESDLWQALSNILGSRELRNVNQALEVLETNTERLRGALNSMSEPEKVLADHYIARIDQMRDFFQLAKIILTTLIERDPNFKPDQIPSPRRVLNTDSPDGNEEGVR